MRAECIFFFLLIAVLLLQLAACWAGLITSAALRVLRLRSSHARAARVWYHLPWYIRRRRAARLCCSTSISDRREILTGDARPRFFSRSRCGAREALTVGYQPLGCFAFGKTRRGPRCARQATGQATSGDYQPTKRNYVERGRGSPVRYRIAKTSTSARVHAAPRALEFRIKHEVKGMLL